MEYKKQRTTDFGKYGQKKLTNSLDDRLLLTGKERQSGKVIASPQAKTRGQRELALRPDLMAIIDGGEAPTINNCCAPRERDEPRQLYKTTQGSTTSVCTGKKAKNQRTG